MSLRKVLSTALLVTAVALPAAYAQTPAPATSQPAAAAAEIDGGAPHFIRPETPEQRRDRLGVQEDPGSDPNPDVKYYRFGKIFTIHKFEKTTANYENQPDGWVRPYAFVNLSAEIYQENEKYVWVWLPDLEPRKKEEREAARAPKYKPETVAYYERIRSEYTVLEPEASNIRLQFRESSNGLPTSGSFRNGLAVGDMNEDGHVDLVLPPERGAGGPPQIFLGDSKGNWKYWDIPWPTGFNYGTVAIADFNKDKHLDLAFAIHLTGLAVFLGDGQGNFRESSEGLAKQFPTRRLVTVDVDRDGWMDIVAISEGPVGQRGTETKDPKAVGSSIRAFYNREKGARWEAIDIASTDKKVGGDWISVGNFNGDKAPDFYGASIYNGSGDTLYMSRSANKWETEGAGGLVPWLSYYFSSVTGRFLTSSRQDDLIVSFFRSWPDSMDPKVVPKPPTKNLVGLDRISFGKIPTRTGIARWEGTRPVWGLGSADFDGDGKLDLAYTRWDPREMVILTGDGAGTFKRATVDGITLPMSLNYDLTVADVNADKRPDLILMYESDDRTAFEAKNGSVQVFLNQGAGKVAAAGK